MNFKTLWILMLACANSLHIQAQSLSETNNMIEYTNEAIHGMFIVHRLLELNNQDINKYVDLEGYKLNAFGNSDLPKDIFEDPKLEFYRTISPNSIYKKLKLSNSSQFSESIRRMKKISSEINALRFSVADYIAGHDMNDSQELGKVYEMLQQCEQLYEDFYGERAFLHTIRAGYVNNLSPKKDQQIVYMIFKALYEPINVILLSIKQNKDFDLQGHVKNLENAIIALEMYRGAYSSNNIFKAAKSNILKKANEIKSLVDNYITSQEIPTEHALYGKFYYYHNYKILHKVNYSGIGLVYLINEFFKTAKFSYPYFLEVPHYYKVIYPERKEKVSVLATAPVIEKEETTLEPTVVVNEIPKTFEEREVVSNSDVIGADDLEFVVELYDHLMLDGDIVSISFNGEWVLKNHSLEADPKKLVLQLNPDGKNYLLLHAENLGRKPPNTIGLSYWHNGRKKKILLKSDLQTSEIIEISVAK